MFLNFELKIKLLAIFLIATTINSVVIAKEIIKPVWWGNDIGRAPIVLPGFSPITRKDNTLYLGAGRQYVWNGSFLPKQILARNKNLLENSVIELQVNGKIAHVKPDTIEILEETDHHVVIRAIGAFDNVLKISVTSRVEYDGVAMVEFKLTPSRPISIEYLHIVYQVKSNSWMKMLAYKSNKIGRKTNKVVIEPNYSGGFLSALSLVDGEKSFWIFQDNAHNWKGDANKRFSVIQQGRSIEIRQKLISSKALLNNEVSMKFNFLATPVKDMVGNIRKNRVATNKSFMEGEYHGLNLWWITAFSHQVLPYTKYPEGVEKRVSASDEKIYPGLFKNKQLLNQYKKFNIDRLPYFSGHVLNHFDPAYQRYKDIWEVHPKIHLNTYKYDNPFTSMRDDTYLTHRAEGYTDYLLYRFSELIDTLGFEGLYFDQDEVTLSKNPLNGLWVDSNKKSKGSTDILALRQFHKRLATLFYLKGKKGFIVSHNSNDMIIPAYTFATSMVQGEEFNHSLRNYDYIDSISLDEIRSRLAGGSYGIPTIWLEVIFSESARMDKSKRPSGMSSADWQKSQEYNDAYENFMTLALLHDMPTWSLSNLKLRTKIMKLIDWVQPETSKFVGYWTYSPDLFINGVYHSYYQSKNKDKYLVVLSNLGRTSKTIVLDSLLSSLSLGVQNKSCRWVFDNDQVDNITSKSIHIKAKQFNLLSLVCG